MWNVCTTQFVASAFATAPSTGCPAVPAYPAGQSPQSLAGRSQAINSQLAGNPMADVSKALGYAAYFAPGQPGDYKNQPFSGASPQYREYGNFAAGVAGASLGFSDTFTKWGAGAASYVNFLFHGKLPPARFGTPVTGSPYGDNPQEQPEIQNGINWARAHASGKC